MIEHEASRGEGQQPNPAFQPAWPHQFRPDPRVGRPAQGGPGCWQRFAGQQGPQVGVRADVLARDAQLPDQDPAEDVKDLLGQAFPGFARAELAADEVDQVAWRETLRAVRVGEFDSEFFLACQDQFDSV